MSQSGTPEAIDFDEQMKALTDEAQVQIDQRALNKNYPGLNEALRPIIAGIEALGRATVQHSAALNKIERAAFAQDSLPALLDSVQANLDQRDAVTQQLFDSLYQELKGYKDQFILELLHKPIIHDLITLFDDLAELHRQIAQVAAQQDAPGTNREPDPAMGDQLKNFGLNLGHVSCFLLEILSRMEVARKEPSTGKLDREMHRAVGVEMADCAEEDGEIVENRKPAFLWRGRLVRPEEVIIKKWKEGFLEAMGAPKK